jgi:putative membrane protein
MEFLVEYYLTIKALHIIFVIFWMAGLFMMPRYLAYHSQYQIGSEEDHKWQEREKRLLRIIMNPAMILAWVFGLLLLVPQLSTIGGWFHIKALLLILLTAFHMMLARWRRQMAQKKRSKSEKFFRMINEVPAIAIIVIVLMAVIKPL